MEGRRCRYLVVSPPRCGGRKAQDSSRLERAVVKGDPRLGCQSSLRRVASGMELCGRSRAGSIKGATSPESGGHDSSRARVPGCVRASSPGLAKAADFSVAQPVVDQGEDPASSRHPADVAAPAGGDAVEVGLELGRRPELLHRLDRRPADESGALLICGSRRRQGRDPLPQRRPVQDPRRAVKAGRRPPGGGALTARSVVRSTMGSEPRKGFLAAVLGFKADVGRRAPLLISVLGPRPGD